MNRFARLTRLVAVPGLAVLLLGGAQPDASNLNPAARATGHGSVKFGHESEGRGFFTFSLQPGDGATGRLLFAAEHHHDEMTMFPEVLIRLNQLDTLVIENHALTLTGLGKLHDESVHIVVKAQDNEDTEKTDRFIIQATDETGTILFEADGEVFQGDIRIDDGA